MKNGVLTSIAPSGYVMTDELVSIDGNKLTLHSLDDGTTYTREKIPPCATPIS